MNERPGAAMRLLYQLFVALNRMKASIHSLDVWRELFWWDLKLQ